MTDIDLVDYTTTEKVGMIGMGFLVIAYSIYILYQVFAKKKQMTVAQSVTFLSIVVLVASYSNHIQLRRLARTMHVKGSMPFLA